MQLPTISSQSTRLQAIARVVMWVGIAIAAGAILATVAGAQNVHGSCNGHGCTGSWGDPTFGDYVVALGLVLLQLLVIALARR